MLSTPPYTSQRKQPWDVSYYGSLETLKQCTTSRFTNHPYEKITPDELGGLYSTAFINAASIEKSSERV
jgi:hypothetical protein